MDNQAIQPAQTRISKRGHGALKLLLVAGLSVQAWGVMAGLGVIVLNLVAR